MVNALPQNLSEGDRHLFHLIAMASPGQAADSPPQPLEVWATLRLVTPHAYFYVEDGQSVSQDDIDKAARDFEDSVYPTVTRAFGQEQSPGVDNDVHITIFNGSLEGAAGYFSDLDEYPAALSPLSNEREMVYIDSPSLTPGSDAYDSVLAHELQHLIHFNGNRWEDLWVNEGMSVVAGSLVGQGSDFADQFFQTPDTQLTEWNPSGDNYAHYGAAGLFFRYLALRSYSVDNLQNLAFEGEKGITGINDYLDQHGDAGFSLGKFDFDRLFANWAAANYMGSPEGYPGGNRQAALSATLDKPASGQGAVNQFAADYIEVDTPGTFTFNGAETVPVIADTAHSGSGQWWSGRGDSIDTTLSREVDLSGVDSATLNFWTWYDIERWYDYGYVEVSTDGGDTWQVLSGRQTTTDDPVRQAYGPAYTGESGDGATPAWVEESVDLPPFAGRKVLLRFEYVTDGGLNAQGWAIDDVSIPEIGFSDDAESDSGWDAQGFQRLSDPLAQRFLVQVIGFSGGTANVFQVPLDAMNDATIDLSWTAQGVDKLVIVIAAITENTSAAASYSYSLSP